MEEKRDVTKINKVLDSYDDGGCFERLLREAEEAARGDEALKERLLTERVVGDLVNMFVKQASLSRSNLIKQQEAEIAKKNPRVVDSYVPRGSKRGPCKRWQLPQQADDQNKKIPRTTTSLKRRFDQIHIQINISEAEQNREPEPEKPKKKAVIKNHKTRVPQVITEMPESFKNTIEEMGGTKVNLVIQKGLTACDLSQRHNRFSIPENQIMNDFLESHEKQRLEGKQSIAVKLIEPCNKVTNVDLRRWQMSKTFVYNITGDWHKKVVTNDKNAFEVDMRVQLYSFRVGNDDNKLCFALVRV